MDTTEENELLKYPIGRYVPPELIDEATILSWIAELAELPVQIRAAVSNLSENALDTSYRPGGWTIRQVVHHIPDSHLNSYCRFKLAVTETDPTIKPYDEAAWAECAEAKSGPIEVSLLLLESLHARWISFLKSLAVTDFQRGFIHPDHGRRLSLDWTLGLYAWHGKHHLAHIVNAVERNSLK